MQTDPARPAIGFAGLGRMGSEMARHLLRAGFDVLGFDPAPEAARRLVAAGGRVADSPMARATAPQLTAMSATLNVGQ